jgi:hypothetical protein
MSREKGLKYQEDVHKFGSPPVMGGPAATTRRKKPRHLDPVAGFRAIDWVVGSKDYFLERLEAFNGLIFCAVSAMLAPACVARLQLPFFHLTVGSGQAAQYHPEAISRVRLHPLHCSTISRQIPPLYPQPLAVMKAHSMPLRTVVHFI